jgi:hypothetical protein
MSIQGYTGYNPGMQRRAEKEGIAGNELYV